jgi:hypothetical protein
LSNKGYTTILKKKKLKTSSARDDKIWKPKTGTIKAKCSHVHKSQQNGKSQNVFVFLDANTSMRQGMTHTNLFPRTEHSYLLGPRFVEVYPLSLSVRNI